MGRWFDLKRIGFSHNDSGLKLDLSGSDFGMTRFGSAAAGS